MAREATSADTSETNEISIAVSGDGRWILVRLSGRHHPDAIVTMLKELDARIERDPTLRVLIDETELRPSFIGPTDIGRFADTWRHAAALRATRLAVFVTNPAMYGLNRMFQGLAGADGRVNVFRDRADAVAWLEET